MDDTFEHDDDENEVYVIFADDIDNILNLNDEFKRFICGIVNKTQKYVALLSTNFVWHIINNTFFNADSDLSSVSITNLGKSLTFKDSTGLVSLIIEQN